MAEVGRRWAEWRLTRPGSTHELPAANADAEEHTGGGTAKSASKRALLTTVDQTFASASNFIVGVAVARIAGRAGLGAFALAYAIWLVLASMHRALVTDPMAIENDARHHEAVARLQRGLSGEIALSVVSAAAVLLVGLALLFGGQRAFGLGLVAIAPWLPFLVVQDYWRWIGFMQRKPGKSLANDTLFNVVQAACFVAIFLAGSRSIVLVIGAWGAGATVASLFGLWQFSVRPRVLGGFAALRSRWHMSKWLAGQSLTSWGASQAIVLVAGAILGPASLGGLRAALTLVSGPTLVLVMAGGSIGLPEASRALAEKGYPGLRRVSLFVAGAGVASVCVVATLVGTMGGTLLRVIYGGSFAQYWPAADFFAVSTLILTFSLAPTLVLKTSKQTRSLFKVQLIGLITSLISVAVLALLFGVTGAAAATLASATVSVTLMLRYERTARRELLRAVSPPAVNTESPLSASSDRTTETDVQVDSGVAPQVVATVPLSFGTFVSALSGQRSGDRRRVGERAPQTSVGRIGNDSRDSSIVGPGATASPGMN